MRRLIGWIIGGLVTVALWVPGAGAQDGRQMYQGMRHDGRDIRQGRQDIRRDWQDIQRDKLSDLAGPPAGNYEALARHRAASWRDRAQLRTDHRTLWHDWRHVYRDRYHCW